MSPDPLGGSILNPQSLNRYSYVLNNPETFIDPSGMLCEFSNGDVQDISDNQCTAEGGSILALPQTVIVNGATGSSSVTSGEGGLKDYLRLLSEATGMNGCGILWCTPNPPPDSNLYLLRLPGNLPRTRPQQPQTQGQNGCLVTVFDPSCKPKELPPCPEVGAKAALDAASSDTWLPPGASPEDLVKAGGGAYAASYIIEHGLVVPMRSSVVRGILGLAEDVSLWIAAAPVIRAEAEGVVKEAKAWSSGTCSTIWTKP